MVTDIDLAKRYIGMRLSAEGSFTSSLDTAYGDAVRELVRIAYSYGVDGRSFWFGMSPSMESEVNDVIEALLVLLRDNCYMLSELGEDDLSKRAELDRIYEPYGGFEEGMRMYLGYFRDEVESLVACGMLLGYTSDSLSSAIIGGRRRPYQSDLWRDGLAMAGVGSVVAHILRDGGVHYGVGRSNVSWNLLDTYGRGYVLEGWMESWLLDYGSDADFFRSYIADNTACVECKEEQSRGWRPIAEYPKGAWHPNCRCIFIFASAEDVEEDKEE